MTQAKGRVTELAPERMIESDLLTNAGGSVKAVRDGDRLHVSGYLVRFSTEQDPDLEGEFFTAGTDFDIDAGKTTAVYYNHGADPEIGKRKIGTGSIKADSVGLWIDAQIEIRDQYEAAIAKLAEAGRLGWSSGTAAHLTEREAGKRATWIKRWPIGLDASLTPTPAEARNEAIASLKTLIQATKTEDDATDATETEQDAGDPGVTVSRQKRSQAVGVAFILEELANKRTI